ncbi:MAG TPA: Ig-like domain-containing protein, partial [Myxococcota bacterium]|nr:Ig-like domain-containing protein [Myxococcota bacterium]
LDAPENIDLGDPLPLTIVLTNHEDEVVVVNVCDPGVTTSLVGLTIDPASNPGWSRAEDPQWPMWCQLVNLPPEEPVTLTLVIDVPPEPGRVISNLTIVVQLAEEDPRTVTSEGTTTVGPAIPSVAVTSPASCEDVGPSSSVLVEVETSIPVGDVDLVELVVDGERVAISRGTGTHSMRWVHPGRGLHCAVARATGEGATAESEPVCFEVLGRGPSYRLTILEPPVPDAESEALDINEDGQVAGVGDDRACRWAPDAACLPDPGRAEAIDDSGRTLVGPRRDGTPTGLYVWEADGSVAPVPLGQNTPGEHRRGFDLSNDGLALYELGVAAANVYGLEARDVSTAEVFSGFVTLSPFDVWPDFVSPAVSPNGQWAVMPMPSFLQALSGPTPPYRSAPLLFEVGQPGYGTDVLDPDVWAFAAAVNDHGAIVGFIDSDQIPWYDPSQPFPTRLTEGHLGFSRQAFRWSRDEGLVDLHQLGARSHARDVSNEGVVVGAFQSWVDAQDRAFVYVCDEMEDLNAKIAPDGGWVLRSANAINESGQIAGTASDDLGRRRAFRLDPAP